MIYYVIVDGRISCGAAEAAIHIWLVLLNDFKVAFKSSFRLVTAYFTFELN
jgi:hypothetical protein